MAEERLLATYELVDRQGRLEEAAAFLAEMETTDPWAGDGPPTPLFARAGGRWWRSKRRPPAGAE